MGTDLDNLLNVTNQIINNLTSLNSNTTTTSELEKKLTQINQDYETQKDLLNKTGVDTSKSNDNQYKIISGALNQQKKLSSDLKVDQVDNTNTIDSSISKLSKNPSLFNQLNGSVTPSTNTSSGPMEYPRTTEGSTSGFLGMIAKKNIGTMLTGAGTILDNIPGLMEFHVGEAFKLSGKLYEKSLQVLEDFTRMGKHFGDKLLDIASGTDEELKTVIHSLGLLSDAAYGDKTKSNQITQNILFAGLEMVNKVGIAFGPKEVAEFQKAYSEISKTSLAFNIADYTTMGEIQKTLEISAQESADLANMFINLGDNVDDVGKFFTSLLNESNKAGMSSREVMKGMKEYFKASNLFKFGNGLQDVAKIMSYSKAIKVDLGGMLSLMDSVSDPSESIDLAQQLQALDTVYLGIDPIDLMGAAMNDVERFRGILIDPLKENIDKYFDIKENKLTDYGRMFESGFMKLKGIDKVFKSVGELEQFFAKAGKTKNISDAIANSAELYSNIIQLSPEDQKNIIDILAAQYQGNNSGDILKGTITSLGNKVIGKLTAADFKMLLKTGLEGTPKEQLTQAAKGQVSIKDQEDINKKITELSTQNIFILNNIQKSLTSKEYAHALEIASNTVMSLGFRGIEDKAFRNINVLMDKLHFTPEEALLFAGIGEKLVKKDFNPQAAAVGGMLEWVTAIFGLDNPPDTKPPEKKSFGGLVQVPKFDIPRSSLGATPKFITPTNISDEDMFNLLSSFMTNQTGPGVASLMGAGTTNVVVSGEIRNFINEKDAGKISGEQILKILEKQITQ